MVNELGNILGFFLLLALVIGFFVLVVYSLKKSQNELDRRYGNPPDGGGVGNSDGSGGF